MLVDYVVSTRSLEKIKPGGYCFVYSKGIPSCFFIFAVCIILWICCASLASFQIFEIDLYFSYRIVILSIILAFFTLPLILKFLSPFPYSTKLIIIGRRNNIQIWIATRIHRCQLSYDNPYPSESLKQHITLDIVIFFFKNFWISMWKWDLSGW